MKLEAVLFDFDGVIADSRNLHEKSWISAISSVLNFEIDRLPDVNISGKSPELIATILCNYFDNKDKGDDLLRLKNRLMSAHLTEIKPFAEVLELFDLLKSKDITFGIASNGSKYHVKQCVENWGFYNITTLGYEDYQHPKPNPEPYLMLAKILGISHANYDNVLILEDSETGLKSALATGMKAGYIKSHCNIKQLNTYNISYNFKHISRVKEFVNGNTETQM